MSTCEIAITAWKVVGIVAATAGVTATITVIGLWFWFRVLGKGDWS